MDNIEILNHKGQAIASVSGNSLLISEPQDALDLMAECRYKGADSIIVQEANFHSRFFDLKTGLAGDILQKFSTYRMRIAIVGDFTKFTSKSLGDFIFESNKMGHVNFVGSVEEAKEALAN